MDRLLQKSAALVARTEMHLKRYLFETIGWHKRLIGIKGARGTGKTTLLLQRLKQLNLPPQVASWWTLDDLYFTANSLVDTATRFYERGGRYLFLDEIHKYPEWPRHLKNLYDFYPDLHIVFTGSSIIDISKKEADLSRRAYLYDLHGMSYREYLNFKGVVNLPAISLDELLSQVDIRSLFPTDFSPLAHFSDYLQQGYYPFFLEEPNNPLDQIQQMARLIVEYDMAELSDFDIRNARKMLQLLYIISGNVPFKPNLSQLAQKSQIHRNSINNYLYFLEKAHLIRQLFSSGISVSTLQKPEKIYLNNTNLAHALFPGAVNTGNIRETFFLSMISVHHAVQYPKIGDFLVDNQWTFEVGGQSKKWTQIADIPESWLVIDDTPFPVSARTLPLWLIGWLY